jgi:type IV pilus assembly protein PilF
MNTRGNFGVAASLVAATLVVTSLLAGCVNADGSAERQKEDPTEQAAKTNIQLGVAYLKQGNLALAKEKLERSLKQNPKDPDVHTTLALLYDRVGEPKLADNHFREALRLAPTNPDNSNNYAVYLCKNGRVEEGVERFSEVATNKYYRTPEVALTNAGVCLHGAKRDEEAQKMFKRAIKARPDYSEATVQLARLQLEGGSVAEARKTVDTYLGAFRPNPEVLFTAVSVARAAKDRMSEEKFSRTLRLEFPESPQARALKRGS